MRIEIPQIFWHGNRDRIMSIDFYPNSNIIVTCGAEEEKMWIKLWEIEETGATVELIENGFKTNKPNPFLNGISSTNQTTTVATEKSEQTPSGNTQCFQSIIHDENPFNSHPNTNKIKPKFLYEISGAHTATVNIVRFSPNGMYLATGGDDSAIVIWVQKSRPVEFGSTIEKVCWSNYKILRGHLSDIYDICWSPDSKYLISGSVDNSAIIFSLEKGKGIQRMNDHNNFVQGVAWDPKNKYVVTQSSDRSAVVYQNAKDKKEIKFFKSHNIKKSSNTNNEMNEENLNENVNMINENSSHFGTNFKEKNSKNNNFCFFGDEIQCPSFVRRLCWSPDGTFCLLVGGIYKENNEIENVVWGIQRKNMRKPAFMLPTLDKSAVCVRFCPVIFKKEEKDESVEELISLDYKIVFAIGTIDSIYIYDTQSVLPRTIHTNIHYLQINDLAWRGDRMLAACSSDGYITFVLFDKNELGVPADPEEIVNENLRNYIKEYNSIDINKCVLGTQNVNVIKNVRRKEEPNANSMNVIVEEERNQNSNSLLFNLRNINLNLKKNEENLEEKNAPSNLNSNTENNNLTQKQITENPCANQTQNNTSGEKPKKRIIPTMLSNN